MTRSDRVIICGDFGGVWEDTPQERYWLDWLDDKPFTTLFVDGNHENFDRLNSGEFEKIEYCGGVADRVRDNVLHLRRGHVFEFEGRRFFCFGGAGSHDIRDGIVDPAEFADRKALKRELWYRRISGEQFRIKGVSWWPQELPDNEEMMFGKQELEKCGNSVDFVITHCLPQEVAAVFSAGLYRPDVATTYLNTLLHDGLRFSKWYCGHYHLDRVVMGKFIVLYETIERIL